MTVAIRFIESLHALGAKLDALLSEARATRELLTSPRPEVRVESVSLADAAKALGCSIRRVEQLLQRGVLRAGPKYGKRAMVTLESIQQALEPVKIAARPRRRATRASWRPIDRGHLR